jgi:hypothetical protein
MKTVQVRTKVVSGIGALFFIAILLSGCLKDVQNTPASPKTYISLMHLAPRAPSVDIFFNNEKASTAAFAPGSVSSYYSAIDPQIFAITIKKAGSDSVVASVPADVYDSLKYYTILIYNTDTAHAAAVKIEDDFKVLTTDKSYYRFFHMSPDIGPVDLYLDNNKLESGRQYADNTVSYYYNQFFQLSPSSYSLYVKKAGTDSVIAQASSITFSPANAYTIFLKGLPGGSGTNALTVNVLQADDRY